MTININKVMMLVGKDWSITAATKVKVEVMPWKGGGGSRRPAKVHK
jgi:hypothetical protein